MSAFRIRLADPHRKLETSKQDGDIPFDVPTLSWPPPSASNEFIAKRETALSNLAHLLILLKDRLESNTLDNLPPRIRDEVLEFLLNFGVRTDKDYDIRAAILSKISADIAVHTKLNLREPRILRQADSFTLFDELPTEIQQAIWKHTLPGPRVIELCSQTLSSTKLSEPSRLSQQAISTLSRTCADANIVVRRHYRTVPCHAINLRTSNTASQIFINDKFDTLYLDSSGAYFLVGDIVRPAIFRDSRYISIKSEGLSWLQIVSLSVIDFCLCAQDIEMFKSKFLSKMPNLKKINAVIAPPNDQVDFPESKHHPLRFQKSSFGSIFSVIFMDHQRKLATECPDIKVELVEVKKHAPPGVLLEKLEDLYLQERALTSPREPSRLSCVQSREEIDAKRAAFDMACGSEIAVLGDMNNGLD